MLPVPIPVKNSHGKNGTLPVCVCGCVCVCVPSNKFLLYLIKGSLIIGTRAEFPPVGGVKVGD